MSSKDSPIKSIGDWGNPPNYATPKSKPGAEYPPKPKEILVEKYQPEPFEYQPALLRECPDCEREALKPKQRYCDECKLKRRNKKQKVNQRKFRQKKRTLRYTVSATELSERA